MHFSANIQKRNTNKYNQKSTDARKPNDGTGKSPHNAHRKDLPPLSPNLEELSFSVDSAVSPKQLQDLRGDEDSSFFPAVSPKDLPNNENREFYRYVRRLRGENLELVRRVSMYEKEMEALEQQVTILSQDQKAIRQFSEENEALLRQNTFYRELLQTAQLVLGRLKDIFPDMVEELDLKDSDLYLAPKGVGRKLRETAPKRPQRSASVRVRGASKLEEKERPKSKAPFPSGTKPPQRLIQTNRSSDSQESRSTESVVSYREKNIPRPVPKLCLGQVETGSWLGGESTQGDVYDK